MIQFCFEVPMIRYLRFQLAYMQPSQMELKADTSSQSKLYQ